MTKEVETLKVIPRIPMNLQLFADPNSQQGGGQQTQQQPPQQQNLNDPTLQAKIMDMFNQVEGANAQQGQQGTEVPLQTQTPSEGTQQPTDGKQPQEQPAQQAPNGQQQPPVDPQAEKILGKFNSPEDLAKAYQNLEGFNTQTRQELSQQNQTIEQLQAVIQQMQQQLNSNTQPPTNPENNNTPNGADNSGNQQSNQQMSNEEFMDQFYKDPIEALRTILTNAVQPQLQSQLDGLAQQFKPALDSYQNQQREADWRNKVISFAGTHPDLQQFSQPMADLLQQYPDLQDHPQGIEILYGMAKGNNYKDPNSLLQDENFVNQNILSNEDIKNKIISDYLNSIKQGQAPITVSGQNNQPSGNIPLTPENKPKNLKEAGAMALKMFGVQ